MIMDCGLRITGLASLAYAVALASLIIGASGCSNDGGDEYRYEASYIGYVTYRDKIRCDGEAPSRSQAPAEYFLISVNLRRANGSIADDCPISLCFDGRRIKIADLTKDDLLSLIDENHRIEKDPFSDDNSITIVNINGPDLYSMQGRFLGGKLVDFAVYRCGMDPQADPHYQIAFGKSEPYWLPIKASVVGQHLDEPINVDIQEKW